MRQIADPAINECAWRIVRRRYEGGEYETEYQEAFERLHRLVSQSVREATAGEEVVEALSRELAGCLEDALQNWMAESHVEVGRRELPHWPRS